MDDNRTILRGQIYYINIDKNKMPIGSEMWPGRPGIIVSNNVNNEHSNTVEIIYLTTKLRKSLAPTHVKVCPANRPSLALCEQICTVDRSRLGDFIDTVSDNDMALIEQAMALSLGIADKNLHGANIFHKWELYINKYQLEIGMQLKELADDSLAKPDSKTKTDSDKINQLESQIEMLKRERSIYKTLYETTSKKLSATEEERDAYMRLYEIVQNTSCSKSAANI